MALLIKKKVNKGSMNCSGCYIQLQPVLIYGLNSIPCDRGIWADEKEFLERPSAPTILSLDEIPNSFTIDLTEVPKAGNGKHVLNKMLYWVNWQVKAQIIELNKWKDSDIEIVNIS